MDTDRATDADMDVDTDEDTDIDTDLAAGTNMYEHGLTHIKHTNTHTQS